MTRVDEDRKIRPVLSDREFDLLLAQARVNDCDFLALRNPAILCTIRLTGKRREEIAALRRRDVYLEPPNLAMNFILLKKHRDKPPERVRYIPLQDPLVQPILEYKEHIDKKYDSPEFWLTVRDVFGNYVVYPDQGLTGRTIYNVVRGTGDAVGVNVWPHLFRETAGAEEVRQDPTLMGLPKVMARIDVTERTAWNYMQRYVMSVIKRDYKNSDEIP